MRSTVYYQQRTPIQPLGSCYALKRLILDESAMGYGFDARIYVRANDPAHSFLRGFVAALGPDDERLAEIGAFLAALEQYGTLEVWIDE